MSYLLQNDQVRLRALEPTDLDTLYAWENDATSWVVTDTIAPFSRQTLWQYLKTNTNDIYRSRQLRLMVAVAEETVGIADFYHFDPLNNRAEVGLYIAPKWRGRGLGGMALRLICDYALNHIGMRGLYAYVRADNAPALATFAGQGFVECGLLRAWVKRGTTYHDARLLQRLL